MSLTCERCKQQVTNEQYARIVLAGFYSRGTAAHVLKEVSDDVAWGGYPCHVTPFELGRAVARALINGPVDMEEAFGQLARGFWHDRPGGGVQQH